MSNDPSLAMLRNPTHLSKKRIRSDFSSQPKLPGTTESRDEQAAVDYELEVEMYENQRIGKECDRQIMTLASAKNNQNLNRETEDMFLW